MGKRRVVRLTDSGIRKLRDAGWTHTPFVETEDDLIKYSGDNVIVTASGYGTTYVFRAEDIQKIE